MAELAPYAVDLFHAGAVFAVLVKNNNGLNRTANIYNSASGELVHTIEDEAAVTVQRSPACAWRKTVLHFTSSPAKLPCKFTR